MTTQTRSTRIPAVLPPEHEGRPSERLEFGHPDKKTIQSLFNAIPRQYDFLNSFFSFGLDLYWRKRLVSEAISGEEESVLDLGVGTGKSLAAFQNAHTFDRAVGCDFSVGMLQEARRRFRGSAELVPCDFHALPFAKDTFDIVTGSFILRSVQDLPHFFLEVKRVLKPGGKAVFLELTRPSQKFIWNFAYKPYLKFYIPIVGKLFSRHRHAYQFLSQSIQSFIEPEALDQEMRSLGFFDTTITSCTFGSATIIGGFKH